MRTNVWIVMFIAVAGLALTGCAETLTYERWDTLYVGSSEAAVEDTLGEPWNTMDDNWVYKSDDDRSIDVLVKFADGQLAYSQWYDPEHGMNEKGENVLQPGESDELRIRETK